ncbi:hypothetical protein [Taylorella equigenitalis]|uniref:hypothetical protein n=1 Tax=Taylorella equigenitalis TaxID=29575 RepID=UPI00237C5CAF|nr:hypothetical protein [Taylorella equigenitalis]WDU54199.1 hypothetical protein KPZ19_04240 [Taylorella equigenitalis]
MKLRKDSKNAILFIIFLVTGLEFYLSGPDETPEPQPIQTHVSTDKNINSVTRDSLTNVTETFVLSENGYNFEGFIKGISYSSFSFFMELNETIQIDLEAHKDLEMMLYGTKTYSLKTKDKFVAPEPGIYELRIFFKPNIEFNLSPNRSESFKLKIKKLK